MMNLKQNPTVRFHKSLETLPVDIIKVDDYQRVLRESNVKKIVNNFDPVGLQHLSISYRDNKYYVFDGQHRLEALKRLGIEQVECIIHYGMTYEDEAKAWDYFNKQITKASKMDEANAALKRGEPSAVALDEAVRDVGLSIDYTNQNAMGKIKAYKSIEKVYKQEGKQRLQDVLLFIRRNLGDDTSALSGWYIEGINEFLNEYSNDPKFDRKWLEKRISKKGFASLNQDIKATQSMYKRGYKNAVVAVFREVYNHNKTYEKRI